MFLRQRARILHLDHQVLGFDFELLQFEFTDVVP